MDLCKRAEEAGSQIWAIGEAVAHHIGGVSSSARDTIVHGCISKHYYQSRFYFMSKHHGRLVATSAEIAEFIILTLRSCVDIFRGQGLKRIYARLQAPLLSFPAQK